MDVSFWFDPGCPFCWMTSRWIVDVAGDRDLTIDWQPISLLIKNETPTDSPFYGRLERTRNLLRVSGAVRAAGRADAIGDLYTAFGRRIHIDQDAEFDVADVLDGLGLDPGLAAALEDESYDAVIRTAMEAGLSLTGPDVGTPLIAIDTGEGRMGLFGPVITQFPEHEAGLRLWDGFVAMAATPGFFELKRTRTGAPDVTTIPAQVLASV
jgi:2-hydroxychromene-2-carboxylate isomerase